MNNNEIKERIRTYVLREFLPGEPQESLKDSLELISGGIVDSLGTIRLTSFLEEAFDLELEPHEMERDRLNTITSITELVATKLASS